ncbi:transposable element Tcb2 transposase [Trichonephila clavipes]|nr:transposable element Tcb2 transposase [Trichonephila clavipes]
MPGKRARRHFSQLSEFERGLIIGMKLQAGQRIVLLASKRCSRLPTSFSDSSMASTLPDLSPVEHVWDQLKRQMASSHSVHDFELTVQDLWVHLPQDNIRCLINSMAGRVVASIEAGGGPTRY